MTDAASKLGYMATNPDSGECIAVFAVLDKEEVKNLLKLGMVFETKALDVVASLFDTQDASRQIVTWGEAIGKFLGKNIPGWIETADGQRHEFVGTAGRNEYPDFNVLEQGQMLVPPGLLYAPIE